MIECQSFCPVHPISIDVFHIKQNAGLRHVPLRRNISETYDESLINASTGECLLCIQLFSFRLHLYEKQHCSFFGR